MTESVSDDELEQLARNANSPQDIALLLQTLACDYRTNQSKWENLELLDYLDGMSGFADSLPSYLQNLGEEYDPEAPPSWRFFAEILLAGRVYE